MLSIWQAVWMAIIQGITEFLPVSSSGHFVILSKILNVNTDVGGTIFDTLLHIGTLAAIIAVYPKDVWNLVKEGVLLVVDGIAWLINKEKHPWKMYPARRLELMIVVACIPTAIIGLMAKIFLEDLFMSSLVVIGFALLITAVFLYFSKRIKPGRKTEADLSVRDAATIGVIQGIGVLPGISRSGSTITTGLAGGYNTEFAVKFSFLISIPAIAGAALLKVFDIDFSLFAANIVPYMIGLALSAVVGYFSIRVLKRLLKNNKFYVFSYYCAAVGLIAIVCGFIF